MSKERNHQLEQRTERFARNVISICSPLPFNSVNKVVIDQLLRSSGSVGANYIEANESLSKNDFVYRIKICRKESREALYWLNLLAFANAGIKDCVQPLEQEGKELFLIFCSILAKVDKS